MVCTSCFLKCGFIMIQVHVHTKSYLSGEKGRTAVSQWNMHKLAFLCEKQTAYAGRTHETDIYIPIMS
jgi:hypothetical protein